MAAMGWSRRQVLKCAAGAATLGLVGLPGEALTQPVRIRRSVMALPPGDRSLEIYRRAVTLMHDLPASDRRSWQRQAKLHNDNCAHKNWFFLPFHRAYLRYFEDICRELTGETDFALPYWDWMSTPRLPPAFVGANSPLDPRFWTDTDPNINGRTHPDGRPRQKREIAPAQAIPISRRSFNRAIALKDFQSFGGTRPRNNNHRGRGRAGQLESGAHDTVHLSISGHMAFNFSPLDPIFWLHHANVDRLWAEWNIKSRNTNPTTRDWRNYDFRNVFANRRGQLLASVKVSEVTGLGALGYTYDTLAETVVASAGAPIDVDISASTAPPMAIRALTQNRANRPQLVRLDASPRAVVEVGTTTSVALPLGAIDLEAVMAKSFPATYEPGATDRRIYLTLSGVTAPVQGDDFYVRVFIATPTASDRVPDANPGFVDQFAFFNTGHAGHGGNAGLEFSFDIVATLQALRSVGRLPTGTLDVQIVPIAFDGRTPTAESSRFTIGKVAYEVR